MKPSNTQQLRVYIIHASTIKRLLLLDMVVGSGIYVVVKVISASVLIASLGSILGTEGLKRGPKLLRKRMS